MNSENEWDSERRRLERSYCRIRIFRIAQVIGCGRATVAKWEKDGVETTTDTAAAYKRIMRGIHNHVTVDYWPCPTLIRMAPDKWTKRRLLELSAISGISVKCVECGDPIVGGGKTDSCQRCWLIGRNKRKTSGGDRRSSSRNG